MAIVRDGKIRLAYIIEATTGGTRRHLYYLLNNIDRNLFDLSLIYSDKRDQHFLRDLEYFRKIGVKLFRVPMHRAISPFNDLLSFLRICFIFKRNRFEVVHAHSSKAGFLGRLAARLMRVPLVLYSPHGFAFQYAPGSFRSTFYLLLEKLASRFHDFLVCVSEGEARIASENLGAQVAIQVIPNHTEIRNVARTRSGADVRQSLNLSSTAMVVGTVAQFRPQKGLNHLIHAIPLVLREHDEATFLLIGDGETRGRIEAQARKLGVLSRIVFAGHKEDVTDYYQIMDVFVLSSLWEGMPYVVLEAMAEGLPVVATDVTGCNELVAHGRTGLLAKHEDAADLARAINSLLRDPQLRRQMGRAARETIEARESLGTWVKRYESIYLSQTAEACSMR